MNDITVTGPFFSGNRNAILSGIVEQATDQISAAAIEAVHFNLDGSIKHPTPYYETQIIREQFPNYTVVHDRGIVYGPWLEGTSQRNTTTRFKGYHSFRRAAQTVQAKTPAIVAKLVAQAVGKLT